MSTKPAVHKFSAAHSITGLEFFRVGTWNDTKFDDADLQEIADNYPVQGWKAAIKLGHDDGNGGQRAWGWVTRVYKVGQKLLADIDSIPDQLFELLKQRAYDACSA